MITILFLQLSRALTSTRPAATLRGHELRATPGCSSIRHRVRRSAVGRATVLLFALLLTLGLLPHARAYSIVSVEVVPEFPEGQLDEVFLKVKIETPGWGAFLARTNDVIVDRDEVLVIMHPDSSPLGALGVLTTNVPLGKLRVGTYRYVVALVPPSPGADWGTKFVAGTFTVVPRLEIYFNPGSGMVLLWPSSAETFVVQYADSLSGRTVWQDLAYERGSNGPFFVVDLEPPKGHRLFRLIER